MLRRNSREISRELVQVFDISSSEAEVYLQAIAVGGIQGRVLTEDSKKAETVDSLVARGMLIRASGGKRYLPVHPRLALSNLFRAYEERLFAERKQRRLSTDRLTIELIPMYEESKNPNLPETRGAQE